MEQGLSVVIPAYNAAEWLMPTTDKLVAAIRHAVIKDFEIIIINDGSTDDTESACKETALKHGDIVKVVSQKNSGRFITRKRGIEAAQYSRVLFVDTRVWVDETAISYLKSQLEEHPDRKVWNGHINVAKQGNIIARFGDALTLVGWRRYFHKPKLSSFGLEDFDHYPKGTGLFSAPKRILVEAMAWFEKTTSDVRNSSDDTLLIRHIAENERIWIAPEFSATYFARTTLRAFMKHTYYRGQYFVDGFLRKGTRFYWPLIMFLVLSIPVLVTVIAFPVTLLFVVMIWLLELIVALLLGLSWADSLSLFILTPIFTVFYAAGIWRATIRRIYNEKQ